MPRPWHGMFSAPVRHAAAPASSLNMVTSLSLSLADYVQRYARPEVVLGRNPLPAGSDGDDEGDAKMANGDESSEGGFLSESEEEES